MTISAAACAPGGGAQPTAGVAAGAQGECLDSGRLTVRLHGAIDADLDWRNPSLECEGMPRPADRGARLRFAGPLEAGGETRQLALIITLPEIERGATAEETPARLTLIEEDGGRFFTTGDIDTCWSDVTRQELLSRSHYTIGGIVYCVAPLAEVQGTAGVTFTELAFAGRVDWSEPE